MAQAKNKTTENDNSVTDFLDSVTGKSRRADCCKLIELFSEETGFYPKMWGPAIIGFGSVHYKYASGREGDMPLTAFSPRKQAITLYFESDYEGREALLARLGKHTTAKVCVYIKKLDDIDLEILKKMIAASTAKTRMQYLS